MSYADSEKDQMTVLDTGNLPRPAGQEGEEQGEEEGALCTGRRSHVLGTALLV